MRVSFGILVLVGSLLVPLTGVAAPVQNTAGLSAPLSTITLDEFVFATGTSITNEYAGLGVTFSPGLQYNSQGSGASFPGVTGNYIGNNSPCCDNPFSILFGGDITAVAFGVATNPATTQFEALNDGLVVESFSAATNFDGSTNFFFGFTGLTFDEIRVTVGGDGQLLFDNIQLGNAAVPEPGTLSMLALALFAAAAVSRRSRK